MLYTLKIRLYPTAEQRAAILETMERFNSACNFISNFAFQHNIFSKIKIQQEIYYQVRTQFNLSAQMVVRAIGKVTESYLNKKTRDTLHQFKPHGAIVYDQRNLTVKTLDTVSFVTLQGRITVAMSVCNYYAEIINKGNRVRGQADLCLINNILYILLVVESPDTPENVRTEFLGVDLGIVKIATTSDGKYYSGATVKNIRKRNFKLRQKLQSKGTKSAKRLLKKRSKKERRFATDINHCISKKLVQVAKGTERGIALEDLTGIRKRTAAQKTVNKTMRQELSAWAFYQLRQFIQYKAKAAGVPVVLVDPRNTSRTCPICGNIDKSNRKTQAKFVCTKCGHTANADINAAINIANRGAEVIQPNAVA